MSITVSGLGSGLDYDSWITELVAIKQADIDEVSDKVSAVEDQEDTLSELSDDYDALQTAIETFTNALSTTDVFNQKSVTSSSEAVTASVTSGASVQDLTVTVSQLATATEAESKYTVASKVDGSTTLAGVTNGTFTAGTFSIYVDGTKNVITLTGTETLDEAVTAITGIKNSDGETCISASVTDGVLSISASGSSTITVGSSSDTSNFYDVMSLTATGTTTNGTTTYTYGSSKTIYDTDIDANITDTSFSTSTSTSTTVRTGTFYINDTEFTISSSTSLDDIIDEINASDAGVTASWNSTTGTFSLTSDDEGSSSIDIKAGTSNFTDVMGLTTSSWTSSTKDGTTTYALSKTALNTAAQTLGKNAILKVNGTTVTSSSNTVTSDVTGITGLTLTLKDTTDTDETAKIEVDQDTSKITSAVTAFVTALNAVIADTDDATATDGDLHGESVLDSMRNKLRTLATAAVTGEDGYTSLASIGITSGAIGSSTSDETNQLVIDTDALTAALADNADAVKTLLLGDDNSGTSGVLTKLETIVDNATDSTDGYFVTKEESYENQVTRLNNKIDKMTTNLEDYQTELENKFAIMDELISALESSASIFDSYFNSDESTSS